MRVGRRTGLGAVLLMLASTHCLSDDPTSPRTDSVSHFITRCVSDADCPATLECLCTVCTIACDTAETCESVSGAASCIAAEDSDICTSGGPAGDFCGIPCGDGSSCGEGFGCANDTCVGTATCPDATTWDEEAGYCVTPWTAIETFSGNQVCGPQYYRIDLPSGMNEFRPRASSFVIGGFLAAIETPEQETLWSFSPNGESDVCNNLWGDNLGTWEAGNRRTAGPTPAHCDEPITPPPLAHHLRGCGIYSFTIEGRALVPPSR